MNHNETPQPLPIAARPHAGDTVESYIHRLARANHLRPSYLRRLLLNNPYALYGGSVDIDRLAALANRHPDALRRALRPAPRSAGRTPPARASPARQQHKQTDKPQLFTAIRERAHRDELSIRLAKQFRVHRRTIRQALTTPIPPTRRKQTYAAPRLGPAKELIDAMLRDCPTSAAGHIWERLLDDHDVLASYSTIRKYIADQRQAGHDPGTHPPEPAMRADSDKIH